MVGWDDNLHRPVEEGYIITGNIITSISYNFCQMGVGFQGKWWESIFPAKTFGIE